MLGPNICILLKSLIKYIALYYFYNYLLLIPVPFIYLLPLFISSLIKIENYTIQVQNKVHVEIDTRTSEFLLLGHLVHMPNH